MSKSSVWPQAWMMFSVMFLNMSFSPPARWGSHLITTIDCKSRSWARLDPNTDKMPNRMPDRMPDEMSEHMPERMPYIYIECQDIRRIECHLGITWSNSRDFKSIFSYSSHSTMRLMWFYSFYWFVECTMTCTAGTPRAGWSERIGAQQGAGWSSDLSPWRNSGILLPGDPVRFLCNIANIAIEHGNSLNCLLIYPWKNGEFQ